MFFSHHFTLFLCVCLFVCLPWRSLIMMFLDTDFLGLSCVMFSSASRICRFMYLPSLGSCQSFELFPLPLLLWGQNDTNSRLRHPAAGRLSSPCLGLFFSPLLGHGLFPPSLCSDIEPVPSTGPVVSVELFGSEIPVLSFLPMYVSCRLRPGFPLFRSRRRARNR